jgi:hypothetical protein
MTSLNSHFSEIQLGTKCGVWLKIAKVWIKVCNVKIQAKGPEEFFILTIKADHVNRSTMSDRQMD